MREIRLRLETSQRVPTSTETYYLNDNFDLERREFSVADCHTFTVTLRKRIIAYILGILRLTRERVTRLELATSSLARLLRTLWNVTHRSVTSEEK
jgi:hypothetical protein